MLIIDDDPDDASILAEIIKGLCSDVHMIYADNGETALQMIHHHHNQQSGISVIILDLNMPRINGTQTLMNIKNDPGCNYIPVVIYSTSINDLEKEKCLLMGAHSYRTKPLSYTESIETATFFIELCKAGAFT